VLNTLCTYLAASGAAWNIPITLHGLLDKFAASRISNNLDLPLLTP